MLATISSLRDMRHVDKTYYLGSDDRFYELNYTHYTPSDELLDLVRPMLEPLGAAWQVRRADVWTHVMPVPQDGEPELLAQGWKIHVSATNMSARDILTRIATLAIARRIQFKFANDVETLRLMTSKRWTRGGSGKFITVYPKSLDEFQEFIDSAYVALKDCQGSYILSDRRYRDSRCLYYRYGGMRATRRLDCLGRRLEVLTSPDGEEVLDQRRPYFELPHWVPDLYPPDPADPQADDAGDAVTLDHGRYVVRSALSFSNTGGVYVAHDTQAGRDVIVKEARPGVELSACGQDATDRLAHEAEILRTLAGLGIVPEVHATFRDWENLYLVEQKLDGDDIRNVMLLNTPLLRVNPTVAQSADFYRIYIGIVKSLLMAVDRIHGRGVVIGDLSPTNILVDKNSGTVRLIDFEGAFRPGLDTPQDIHTPGFRSAAAGRARENSFADDIYAVGVIMMYSMFPIAAMAHLREDVFDTVLPVLVADIGWADTPVLEVARGLIGQRLTCRQALALLDGPARIAAPLPRVAPDRAGGAASEPALGEVERGLAGFITANCRFDDKYTLFPIDPYGLHSNPLGFGFGASGIVATLHSVGVALPAPALERFRHEIMAVDPDDLPPGLLIGTAGMALALLGSGDPDGARRFLDHANASPLAYGHHSLYYGMAGIGMVNLAAHRQLGDAAYLARAVELAGALRDTARRDAGGVHWHDGGGIRIGFGYGQSGVALFLLRLSQILDAPEWRALGEAALDFDLAFGHEVEAGIVSFPESPDNRTTLEQYIEQGSAGIAKVAIRYGRIDRIGPLLADLDRKYSGFPGLIYGLSGFVDVLTDAHLYSGDARYLEMARRPVQGLLDLYLFKTEDGLAMPGENLFRISCDYATGLAGVVRTLYRRRRLIGDAFCLDTLDGFAVA